MLLRALWFITLMLAALGLGLGWAHVLEMPVKMTYDAATYTAVTSTLYRFFGLVGGPVQVAALLAAIGLTVLTRRRRSFRLVLAGVILLGVSLALWAALVQPVNLAWTRALAADPDNAPQAYLQLRTRWEYGHVAAFIPWLLGTAALVIGLLREVPSGAALTPGPPGTS